MGTFSQNAKPWLRSIIAQRKLLIRINRSHIDQVKAKMAISRLETQLNAYPFDNDIYLARFINRFSADIEAILPGGGSPSQKSRQSEWTRIKVSSLLISQPSLT